MRLQHVLVVFFFSDPETPAVYTACHTLSLPYALPLCAEVDRIATLIDQMEHFSRGQPIACSALNLYPPIHQAMEAVRARQVPNVRFIEDFDPSLPLVLGNHDAMVQIVLNLVTNACEALGEIGRAHVRTPVTNAHLVCRLLLEKKK